MEIAEFAWTVVLAAGGGAAVAATSIRMFGEKWLDSKFAGKLQDLRHEHERQMEEIRLRSSEELDRAVRLSEREFETTAEIWGLVTEARVKTMSALPGFRRSYDFSKLSDKLARIAAEQADFADWEIDGLLERPQADRSKYFHERVALKEIANARAAIINANTFLVQNSLFLDSTIYAELDAFLDSAWQALVAWEIVGEVRSQGGGPADLEGIRRDDENFRKGSEEKLKQLEETVRSRFWPKREVDRASD